MNKQPTREELEALAREELRQEYPKLRDARVKLWLSGRWKNEVQQA